jgi:hypothetical protein
MNGIRRITLAVLALLLWPQTTPVLAEPSRQLTDERVEVALQNAIQFLWSQQRGGRWISDEFEKNFPGGLSALTAFTLRSAGTPVTDHRLQLAAHHLKNRDEMITIYARSFTLMLWCSLDPERYWREIDEDVRFLSIHQHKEGGWGYSLRTGDLPGKKWQDNSNTQLALLALWEAANAGADVSKSVWRKAEKSWLASQNEDGGWGYPLVDDPELNPPPKDSYGSMTAAGLASLHLIYGQLYAEAELPFNGTKKAYCGKDIDKTRPIRQSMDRARQWLEQNYRVDEVPKLKPGPAGNFREDWWTYYLYCLDRVGVATGQKRIAGQEWYRDVAQELIARQQPDGSWGNVYQTCFGVLALLKARSPVLINKLKFGTADDWNRDPNDAANLTHWYSRLFETQQTWQVCDLQGHPEELRDAPILYITGHNAPQFDDAQRALLRDFVWSGGTIVAVACCSTKEFVEVMGTQFAEMFPRLTRETLPEDHLIWSIHVPVEPGEDVIGFSDRGRTVAFILTNGACCAWHQDAHERFPRLFDLGSNILRYATYGRPLRGRLTPFWPREEPEPSTTITVARLKHGGDYWSDPYAERRLSEILTRRTGLGLEERPALDFAGLPDADAQVLWLCGHEFVPPDQAEAEQLKTYLQEKDALLFASPSYGSAAFDEAFQAWAIDLFGADRWEMIPSNDPIMTGELAGGLGSTLAALTMRRGLDGLPPMRLDWPILHGVRHEGRWILIYSPYDVCCGLIEHPCINCVGYEPNDAAALASNVMLYAAIGHGTTDRKEPVPQAPAQQD